MPDCDNCGSHVSKRFASVFSDPKGRIFACPNCSAKAGIAETSRDRMSDSR